MAITLRQSIIIHQCRRPQCRTPRPAGVTRRGRIGIVSSLALPSEALWRRAAHEMESPLVKALGFSPFASSSVRSGWMVGYAVPYAGAALLLAVRRFARRDL